MLSIIFCAVLVVESIFVAFAEVDGVVAVAAGALVVVAAVVVVPCSFPALMIDAAAVAAVDVVADLETKTKHKYEELNNNLRRMLNQASSCFRLQ